MTGSKLEGTCHCRNAGWTIEGDPGSVTACNCTSCRRYGALWAYGYENEQIEVRGTVTSYVSGPASERSLETCFCPVCGNVVFWRSLRPGPDGRRRMAVNVRLARPDDVFPLVIDHFDGLDSFEDLPSDGKCVRDLWA